MVKEADLKSVGLCPRRFKSCRCRFLKDFNQAEVAQLGERQTEDLKVAGSIPAVGILILFYFFSKCK